MPFVHPALFGVGAAAISVPILIHLLNRRRFKIVEWAAMKFLLESVRKNRRRVRIEELILLALRCLAILLLAVAVSRFLGCAPPAALPVTTAMQTTHVFILDDSVSMGQKIADTTAFRKAASDLADMLEHVSAADRVAVLLTSRPQRTDAVFDLKDSLSEPEALAGRVKSLKVSDTRARLNDALKTAAELFDEVTMRKRLYLLSDFRRVDFVAAGDTEDVRRQLRDMTDAGVELVLMNYGAKPGTNLTAQSIKVLNKLVIASLPIRVQVGVRNNGPKRAENVTVSFSVHTPESLREAKSSHTKLPARTIASIDPGQVALVQVACELPAGAAVVSAELAPDSVAGDNTISLALDVKKARKILIVEGEQDPGDPARNEAYFLRSAIDPTGDQRYGSEGVIVSADHLAEVDFNNYEAVILANVSEFPLTPGADGKEAYAQLEALAAYVRSGGGLAIFTGDRVHPTFYNGAFYKAGTGLCPMKVAAPVKHERHERKFVRLLKDSIASDPVMHVFQGQRSQFTQFVRFYGYTPVEEVARPALSAGLGPVKVLAKFDNTEGNPQQSPAIVSRAYGRGAVMMICSSADTEWNDWPKDLTFLPFVHDMLTYLSRAGGGGLTDLVGRRISYAIPPERAAAIAKLQTPAFPAEDLKMLEGKWVGPRRHINYEHPRHAGVYQLKLELPDEQRVALFARNPDPKEGRLERGGKPELQGWLNVEFKYVDKLASSASAEAAGIKEKREYWKLALILMLFVLAVEVFLGQLFGHYR